MPRIHAMFPAPHEVPFCVHSLRGLKSGPAATRRGPWTEDQPPEDQRGLCSLVCHFNTLVKRLPRARYRVSTEATGKDKKTSPKASPIAGGEAEARRRYTCPAPCKGAWEELWGLEEKLT